MFNKLAFRNAKRSIKDYFVYLITMVIITSLMFAFNAMIFSEDIIKMYSMAGVMAVMIGLASVFIVFVVSWLVKYMVTFMMEKKSKEFGVYLLIGMKKKEIASLFIKENCIIGILSFVLGILPGIFLQQVFTTIFMSLFGDNYSIKIDFSLYGFLLTLILYFGIYFIALIKSKRKLKKMTIRNMMDFEKQNDKFSNKNEKNKVILFILAIIYFIVFDIILLMNKMNLNFTWLFIALLIVSIYLFYIGVSSFVVRYINKGSNGIFKNESLFLLRQFSSKIRNMQFTMATLTILFVFSILGCTIAMMFNDFLDNRMSYQFPFDIIVFSDDVNDDFKGYLDIVEDETKVEDKFIYNIYEDGSNEVNQHLWTKVTFDTEKDPESDYNDYFDYDTFMKESDYNRLRNMLSYEEVDLSDDGFIIHAKNNIMPFLEEYLLGKEITKGGRTLVYEGSYTEGFSQSGQNGADYMIVIPDEVAQSMEEYYSLLAVDIEGDAPEGLQEKLDAVKNYYDDDWNFKADITWGFGTDQILTSTGVVLVGTNLMNEMKFIVSSVSFPFIYIALVFLCVALTILSVQQISDSTKYKYRYSVLRKLGLKEREVDKIILKQLLVYYLTPLIISLAISSVIAVYISNKFIYFTGIENSSALFYYGVAISVLLIIYIIYFIATYVEFKRNVNS